MLVTCTVLKSDIDAVDREFVFREAHGSYAAPPWIQVSADGATIENSFTLGGSLFTWDLHSEAQP